MAEPWLGRTHRYVDGRVFVTEVLPESQAEVDEVVLAGDVLDEINGCSLRNASSGQVGGTGGWHVLPSASPARPPSAPLHPPLQAGAMVQKLKGQPLSFRVLRWRWHDGEVYEPLLPYLKVLKEKEPRFQLQRRPQRRVERETRKVQGGRWALLGDKGGLRASSPAKSSRRMCGVIFSPGCSTTCGTWAGAASGR